LKPAIRILKKITRTSPPVYCCFAIYGVHPSTPYTQFDPNQNPSAYEDSIEKKSAPIPAPEITAYFVAFEVTSLRHLSY